MLRALVTLGSSSCYLSIYLPASWHVPYSACTSSDSTTHRDLGPLRESHMVGAVKFHGKKIPLRGGNFTQSHERRKMAYVGFFINTYVERATALVLMWGATFYLNNE